MERRLLLVFALTFLVIILFQPLLKKYLPQTAALRRPKLRSRRSLPLSRRLPRAAPRFRFRATGATKQASAEAETVVENDLYRVTFTNRGGQVKSWVLKKLRRRARQASGTGQQGGGRSTGIRCRCGPTTRPSATS